MGNPPWKISVKHIEEETHYDQLLEDHPIFTCQICVEPMQPNKNSAKIIIMCTLLMMPNTLKPKLTIRCQTLNVLYLFMMHELKYL